MITLLIIIPVNYDNKLIATDPVNRTVLVNITYHSACLLLGRLTQDAIAAVSLANQISFVMSLFNGAAIGAAGVLIAQYWGKGDYKNAKRFLGMAVRYAAVISFIFFLLAFMIPERLMM
ncbi:MAG: hypothetical protein K5750_05895, partial [Eubacterium sp.]|nr:hypothetical protein [Eubacterium sp.]